MQYFKSGKLRLVALFFVYWERNYTSLGFTGGKGQAEKFPQRYSHIGRLCSVEKTPFIYKTYAYL